MPELNVRTEEFLIAWKNVNILQQIDRTMWARLIAMVLLSSWEVLRRCVCVLLWICVCVVECCSNNSQWEQISVWSLWWQHQERKRWWLSSPALDSNWPSISSFVSNTHTHTDVISYQHRYTQLPSPCSPKIQNASDDTCVNVCLLRTDTQHTHGKHHHLNNRWRLEMTGRWRSERGSVEN